ncbi:MAG: Holliday junction branch migration protein RuvA [bacterium]|nr:Holliday junction branch migration protein RuvA [bacterium]
MIGSIKGPVQYKGKGYIIVQSKDGVGYKLSVTPIVLTPIKLEQEISLFVLTYVREDQLTLYGFKTMPELEFFEMLISVSGIGPKSALSIMSLASVEMIKSAIVSEDPTVFTKVSGIGRKTAERVIVELKEKLKDEVDAAPVAKEHSDTLDALVALGYTQQEAREALKKVPKETTKLQDKIKAALKNLK